MSPLTIIVMVDVLAALSDRSLDGAIHMMDNGLYSEGQGTGALITRCAPGQLITWVARAIDVQTPVLIGGISFVGPGMPETEAAFNPDAEGFYWAGLVPYRMGCGLYHYRLSIQMGHGATCVMHTDAPALRVVG